MAVIPRHASTVVLMRDRRPGVGGPEVLLVRRHQKADFAAGAYVFPGGVLEEGDCTPLASRLSPGLSQLEAGAVITDMEPPEKALGLFVAAIRETFEEVGVLLVRSEEGGRRTASGDGNLLDAARAEMSRGELLFLDWVRGRGLRLATEDLVYFAHWITPEGRPKRFDTRFFLAEVPQGEDVRTDGREVFEHLWVPPAEAGNLIKNNSLKIMTPTLKNLELLSQFGSTADAVAALRQSEVPTILPKIHFTPDGERIVLHPWDSNYDTL